MRVEEHKLPGRGREKGEDFVVAKRMWNLDEGGEGGGCGGEDMRRRMTVNSGVEGQVLEYAYYIPQLRMPG